MSLLPRSAYCGLQKRCPLIAGSLVALLLAPQGVPVRPPDVGRHANATARQVLGHGGHSLLQAAGGFSSFAEAVSGYSGQKLSYFWLSAISLYLVTILIAISLAMTYYFRDGAETKEVKGAVVEAKPIMDLSQASLRGLDDDHDGNPDEKHRPRFEKEMYRRSLRTGSYFLGVVAVAVFCYNVVDIMTKPDCLGPVNWYIDVPELLILAICAVMMVFCVAQPTDVLYWPVVLFFFFYVSARAIPPFKMGCGELQSQCSNTTHWKYQQMVRHVDCGLQGHTATQYMMSWFLLLPWILPRVGMMNFVWIYIVLVYGGWTWAYRKYFGETEFFTLVDVSDRSLLLCFTLLVAIGKKFYLEKSQFRRFVYALKQRQASERMFNILQYMVPVHVVLPMLRNPGAAIADQADRVTILFIMIADFDQFAHRLSPKQLLKFLNNQFTKMDHCCIRNKVTKIETVGEEYVAAVGVVPADVEENNQRGHGPLLAKMFAAAGQILTLQTDDVKFRMGMHTGKVVAGVIGQKLPRYRLFGDTINTAARMMQKGLVGQCQFGEETFSDVPATVKVKLRGDVEMKGKGMVKAYVLDTEATADEKNDGDNEKKEDEPPPANKKRLSVLGALIKAADDQDPAADLTALINASGAKEGPRASVEGAKGEPDENAAAEAPRASVEENPLPRKSALAKRKTAFDPALATRQTAFEQVQLSFNEDPFEADITSVDGSVFDSLVKKDYFSPEMEEEWYHEYHNESICRKIDKRVGRYTVAIFLLTILESVHVFNAEVWMFDNEMYSADYRLPVFMGTRALAMLIMLSLWMMVVSSRKEEDEKARGEKEWVTQWPRVMQWTLCLSNVLVAALMFTSYDAMTVAPDVNGKEKDKNEKMSASFEQIFPLIFVIVFFLLTRQHQFLFFPSLVFAILAAAMMYFPTLFFVGKHFFGSFSGQMLFVANTFLNAVLAHEEEQSSRQRYKAKHSEAVTKQRTERILDTLMPPLVVKELRELPDGMDPPSHQYRHATIAQSDMCGFTKLASTRTPQEVVTFMGELFGMFDVLTDKHGVYKVETIGDAYIAGMADQPLTMKNNPISVLLFGLDMVEKVAVWARNMGVDVTCRVGVHHGECIGGIVGNDMQRYHLFGDLMTVLEVLESTAPEAQVQISKACKVEVERYMQDEGLCPMIDGFDQREIPHMLTSKGEIHNFDEVGGNTYVVRPSDAYYCA